MMKSMKGMKFDWCCVCYAILFIFTVLIIIGLAMPKKSDKYSELGSNCLDSQSNVDFIDSDEKWRESPQYLENPFSKYQPLEYAGY